MPSSAKGAQLSITCMHVVALLPMFQSDCEYQATICITYAYARMVFVSVYFQGQRTK